MSSKIGLLIMAIMGTIVLFLIGGFVFGKNVGIVCVFLGIVISGLAAGNLMNSPEPDHPQH